MPGPLTLPLRYTTHQPPLGAPVRGGGLGHGLAHCWLPVGRGMVTPDSVPNGPAAAFDVAPSWGTAPSGHAWVVDGTHNTCWRNYQSANSPAAITGAYTVACLFRMDTLANDVVLVSTRCSGLTNGTDYTFDMQFLNSTTIHGDIGTGTGQTWLSTSADATVSPITVGSWHALMYAVWQTGYAIYFDGLPAGGGSWVAGVPMLWPGGGVAGTWIAAGSTFIGGWVSPILQGAIGGVWVWSRALNATEAKAWGLAPFGMF